VRINYVRTREAVKPRLTTSNIQNQSFQDAIALNKEYEIDELRTYYKSKARLLWIVCALQKDTGAIADFAVGSRTLKTIKRVTDTVVMAGAVKIYTHKLNLYSNLLPKSIHSTKQYSINHLERKHLSMRTHLKRLARRTICFSRSRAMLEACVKIYCWGKNKGFVASQ
jgi:insertion element IS1 protein InsB